jgi:hypothetical protein
MLSRYNAGIFTMIWGRGSSFTDTLLTFSTFSLKPWVSAIIQVLIDSGVSKIPMAHILKLMRTSLRHVHAKERRRSSTGVQFIFLMVEAQSN